MGAEGRVWGRWRGLGGAAEGGGGGGEGLEEEELGREEVRRGGGGGGGGQREELHRHCDCGGEFEWPGKNDDANAIAAEDKAGAGEEEDWGKMHLKVF